jgi:threonine aldolase
MEIGVGSTEPAMNVLDLRTEVVAPPTEEMWAAMRAARLGWASVGEDESVGALERLGAEVLGKEAAVLVPTCGMANLVALLALAPAGASVAIDPRAHIVVNEGNWLTQVARLEPVGLGDDAGVICLENTHTRRGGTVLAAERTAELAARAPRSHLDGARLPNAAVALGVPMAALAAPCDTVALSLNKGLGAPYGALLAGDEATVAAARVHLKRLGGATVHKVGFLAAAGIVALETMVDRLADDHRRARDLARLIGADEPETNLVYADLGRDAVDALRARGVLALELDGRVRFVTHRSIGDEDVRRAADAIASLRRVPATG